MTKVLIKKRLALLGLGFLTVAGMFACGGGSDSSTSSTGANNALTSLQGPVRGVSTVECGPNAQCIDFSGPATIGAITSMARALSTAKTDWFNTSNSIITTSKIPYVQGSNNAKYYSPEGSVFAMRTDANYRYFKGNGLPNTPMGTFPVKESDPAYPYYYVTWGGENIQTGQQYNNATEIEISAYDLTSKVPLNPVATGFYPINSVTIGISLSGALFQMAYAPDNQNNWYDATNALPLDQCWGHPYNALYHHHAYAWKCFDQGTPGKQSPIYGFALDGFPITGPRGADGKELTNKDLDACHGKESVLDVPDGAGGFTRKLTYHYVMNREFPYAIGCFRGKVNYIQALGSEVMRDTKLPLYQDVPYPQ